MMNVFVFGFILFSQLFSSQAFNNDGYLDISAFNVQIFGQNKMENPMISKTLVKIILRYDLLLLQEIRDSSGLAIVELMNMLRKEDDRYAYVISERLGRSTSKEQYAYIYRKDWLTPVRKFVYNDVGDVFEREPFIVQFQSSRANIEDFVCVGIHTKPSDAVAEINQLANVYDHIVAKMHIKDVVLMGDFNAGCDYVRYFNNIALATDPTFYWLTTDVMDTTTKNSDCAYDRFVIAGENFLKSIVPTSTGVFHYDQAYDLTPKEAILVSDHYPIQFQLVAKTLEEDTHRQDQTIVEDNSINQALAGNYREIYTMKRNAEQIPYYTIESSYGKSGAYLEIRVLQKVAGVNDAVSALETMQKNFPKFVSKPQLYSGERWIMKSDILSQLPQGFGKYKTLYDFYLTHPAVKYTITLSCSLKDRAYPTCSLIVDKN